MTELLHIREPGPVSRPKPQWRAFLELGFRPLYLAGCLWAAMSIALWIFAPQWLRGTLNGMFWHAHEMLWAFVATIALGFLLTAGATWTGINPMKGRALGILTALWVAARIGFLIPGAWAFGIAAACELTVFAWAGFALSRAIFAAHNQRNYGVPLLVFGLGMADGLCLWAVTTGRYALLLQSLHVGVLCMAVLALLVARRVIPFFAMRAISGLNIPMHTRSGHGQIAAAMFAIACLLLGWLPGAVTTLAAAGLISLWQVLTWRPWAVRRVPLLWILYAGYAGLGAGLLMASAHLAGQVVNVAWPMHTIGLAGFSVLIIGMVTRTALGHLGQPLRTDALIVGCYGLVIAAATLRLLALLPETPVLGLLHASAGIWMLGFGLYLWRFLPMMIRPRVDQPTSTIQPVPLSVRVPR
ncbi:MAG: NnrS family protein [Burkholderiaceae bacterium]|jgi:uncharacterized protein involved in response to NO|nr:NnrS family protein [Burkholderiaceae bacterium]